MRGQTVGDLSINRLPLIDLPYFIPYNMDILTSAETIQLKMLVASSNTNSSSTWPWVLVALWRITVYALGFRA
jgi:hypothetical protein